MLLNMATNKKCHNHLGNKSIINFITSIFQLKFYEKYKYRAENDACKTTIKNILHIFSRLIHESIVSPDILESDVLPVLTRVETNLTPDCYYSKDLSFINRKLNESLSYKFGMTNRSLNETSVSVASPSTTTNGLTFGKNRQESYV